MRKLLFALALFVVPGLAAAQPIDCKLFQRNQDGTWSPTQAVTIRNNAGMEISMSAGTSFRSGTSLSGVDIAALLDTQCPVK